MKKIAMIALFGLILFGFSAVAKASEPTCDNGYHYDSEQGKCVLTWQGDTLLAILANQCKEVEYTPWTECDTRFNFQFRTIIKPINGCRPTGIQQAYQLKRCGSINLGIE